MISNSEWKTSYDLRSVTLTETFFLQSFCFLAQKLGTGGFDEHTLTQHSTERLHLPKPMDKPSAKEMERHERVGDVVHFSVFEGKREKW